MLDDVEDHITSPRSEKPVDRLTPRELQVLEAISLGLTNAEAARRLDVSVHAIKFHLAGIYSRLDVHNRTEAAVAFLRSRDVGSTGG